VRRFVEKKLLIATHNQGKLEEIQALLAGFGVEVVSAGALGLAVPEETETTFVGNARIKAWAGVRATGLPALADDSGITVDGLDGAPGVYTADWAEVAGGRDFDLAMRRTWNALEAVAAPEPRLCQFRCTLVLAWPDGHEEVFEGVTEGRVVWPGRGRLGHGYDPIFLPVGSELTFGEMDRWEKNRISHRGRAFDAMIKGCFT
jgi:XTP/dITP diphosphohydrolase